MVADRLQRSLTNNGSAIPRPLSHGYAKLLIILCTPKVLVRYSRCVNFASLRLVFKACQASTMSFLCFFALMKRACELIVRFRRLQDILRVLLHKLEDKMKGTSVAGTIPRLLEGKKVSFIRCKNIDLISRSETLALFQVCLCPGGSFIYSAKVTALTCRRIHYNFRSHACAIVCF